MLTFFLEIPGSKRINENFFTPVLPWALPGSPRLSLVLGGMQVKEMSREMGVSKLIVKCLFSPTLFKQTELVGLYKRDYSLDLDITL